MASLQDSPIAPCISPEHPSSGFDLNLRASRLTLQSIFPPLMSDHADEKNAAEDPAAAEGPRHAEGKPMTELERIRHSAAHILATAILRIWPEAQFAGCAHVMSCSCQLGWFL